jgi:beta-glucosidase
MEQILSRRTLIKSAALATGGAILGDTLAACTGSATSALQTPAPQATITFPQGFLWGVATSAFQIEGAVKEDGRGQSIWDTFNHMVGKIVDGSNADVADDHYHRYLQDLDLMHRLGIQSYRFSISWPRILPSGSGTVNQKGLDFYRRLVDGLHQRNIRPMATLFHWDLPQALQDEGGWENRDVAHRFADYADVLFQALGNTVPVWLTLNEPKTVVNVGYIQGVHAPGISDPAKAYKALHHMLLGHGLAVQAFRARNLTSLAQIGAALNLNPVYGADTRSGTAAAVTLQDGYENRLYLDPILKGSYPADVVAALHDSWPDSTIIQSGDLGIIGTPITCLGVNYYNPVTVTAGPRIVGGTHPTSVASWEEVYPPGMHDILVRLKHDYGDIPLYITENGAPYIDLLASSGEVIDPQRQTYIHDHLVTLQQAITAGVQVKGYHAWSLLDNFEWAEGYTQRWGMVYVDYPTQQRYPKDTALWYSDVIKHNGIAGSS